MISKRINFTPLFLCICIIIIGVWFLLVRSLQASPIIAHFIKDQKSGIFVNLSEQKLLPKIVFCAIWICTDLNATNQLSISVWIKPRLSTTNGKNQYIVSKWDLPEESFQDDKNYTLFETTRVNSQLKGFAGAVYDGKYVYFVPIRNSLSYSGYVGRYDTGKPFQLPTSWNYMDTSRLNTQARGFGGGVFDGRYIYFIPNYNDDVRSGLVTRYDTQLDFTASEAWEFFDMTSLQQSARGFWGGVFDGRYIYFVPHNNGSDYIGLIPRFDTTKILTDVGAWEFFDSTKLNKNLKGFTGGVFDGQYIYFIPNRVSITQFSGLALRYNTKDQFEKPTSWSYFDVAQKNREAVGFGGGVFDGRYIYFVPLFSNTLNFGSTVTRYDTSSSFTEPASWNFFDLSKVSPNAHGYIGSVTDGRFIYFIPFRDRYEESTEMNGQTAWCPKDETGGFSGKFVRFDTAYDFGKSSSWSLFDTTQLHPEAKGFWGGVFDGRFVYIVPVKYVCSIFNSNVIRFDTLGTDHGSYRLIFSQSSQNGAFSASPVGVGFEINSNNGHFLVTSNETFEPNQWYQLIAIFDSQSLKLYRNGTLIGQNNDIPRGTFINNTTDQFNIGLDSNNKNAFEGEIDDLTLYRRTLSDQEIKMIFTAAKRNNE